MQNVADGVSLPSLQCHRLATQIEGDDLEVPKG